MSTNRSKLFLGIDTSCYTTSIALFNSTNDTMETYKKLLPVKPGALGLRQSEMIFHHIKALPELLKPVNIQSSDILAIGVSDKPRSEEGSYMPAFLAGTSLAQSLSNILQVPLFKLSHQENHLLAAKWSADMPSYDKYLFVHLSGGTTEFIIVNQNQFTLVASTMDISAGQFVDRVGVKLGLNFPCGPHLEALATHSASSPALLLPVAVKQDKLSFAGPCSAALRLLDKNPSAKADIALAVLQCISTSLYKIIKNLSTKYEVNKVLLAGGVAANTQIKSYLHTNLQNKNIKVFVAQPIYSSDNAAGCALYAEQAWSNDRKILYGQ